MQKNIFVCLLSLLPLCFLVSCTLNLGQSPPEGTWKCSELQATFHEDKDGRYVGTIGDNGKPFEILIPVSSNIMQFYYQGNPEPFFVGDFYIRENIMLLCQGGRVVYTFCRIDEDGPVRLRNGRTGRFDDADLRCEQVYGVRQPEP